jgi:outer membrane protein
MMPAGRVYGRAGRGVRRQAGDRPVPFPGAVKVRVDVMDLRTGLAIGLAIAFVAGGAEARSPRTLAEALAAAYANNPTLQAARAGLRATDETVAAALAGWRPQVSFSGSAGTAVGKTDTMSPGYTPSGIYLNKMWTGTPADRNESSAALSVTQPLYMGGKTSASTHKAKNTVMATRAQLIASEQQVFSDTVTAYVTVIQDQQLLALDVNNEQVLTKQLQATNDRFRVGEITRTDVAQAEAALAGAVATRQSAEGSLQTARATYQREVGELPPDNLVEPQPLKLPTKTIGDANAMAAANNPNVVAALFTEAAAKDAFDVAYAALMPNLSLQGQAFRMENTTQAGEIEQGGQVLANLTVPIYQGGQEYAAIRQARQTEQQARKQVDDQRRQAVQAATSAWETYAAAKATIDSDKSAIHANEIALEGVQREAIVGSRTTLDVLNAEQALLASRVTLVQTLASFVTASYQVAVAVGRLTARDLDLHVPLYDETAYFNAVHNRWIGTGDYATDQPGR